MGIIFSLNFLNSLIFIFGVLGFLGGILGWQVLCSLVGIWISIGVRLGALEDDDFGNIKKRNNIVMVLVILFSIFSISGLEGERKEFDVLGVFVCMSACSAVVLLCRKYS